MIDLHIHSTHSDGTDDVIDILIKAQNKNLTHISITDHNTCSAYNELQKINIKQYYSGKIIYGIELNTVVLGIPIEVLGYNIDVEIMTEKLKGIYLTPEERNCLEVKRLYRKCINEGVNLSSDFISNYLPNQYASKYLHQALRMNEENRKFIDLDAWNDSLVLYRKYMSDPNSIFFVDMNDVLPNFDRIEDIIRKSGGKLFLPHIFEYKHNSKKILDYILKNYKVDGIECYYSTFTKKQTKELLNLCKEKNLLISGGSDYHGRNLPGIDMGTGRGNLYINNSIVLNWGNFFMKN